MNQRKAEDCELCETQCCNEDFPVERHPGHLPPCAKVSKAQTVTSQRHREQQNRSGDRRGAPIERYRPLTYSRYILRTSSRRIPFRTFTSLPYSLKISL